MSDKSGGHPIISMFQALPPSAKAIVAAFALLSLITLFAVVIVGAYTGRGVELWGLKIHTSETPAERVCRLMTQAAASNPMNNRLDSLKSRADNLEQQISKIQQQCLSETANNLSSHPNCTIPPQKENEFVRSSGRASVIVQSYPPPLPASSERYQAVLSHLDQKLKMIRSEMAPLEEDQRLYHQKITRQCSGLEP